MCGSSNLSEGAHDFVHHQALSPLGLGRSGRAVLDGMVMGTQCVLVGAPSALSGHDFRLARLATVAPMDAARQYLRAYYEEEARLRMRKPVAGRRVGLRDDFVSLLNAEGRRSVVDFGAGPTPAGR
jgi:hypothetical protein